MPPHPPPTPSLISQPPQLLLHQNDVPGQSVDVTFTIPPPIPLQQARILPRSASAAVARRRLLQPTAAAAVTAATHYLHHQHHRRSSYQTISIPNPSVLSPVPAPTPTAKISFLSNLVRRFTTRGGDSTMSAAAKAKVEGIVGEHAVVVFSKSYCPYCRASKKTLSSLGVEAFVVELDEVEDGQDLQNALAAITGQRTVPNIFIGKEHVGGNSDLQDKKASGELVKLLENAGALKGKL